MFWFPGDIMIFVDRHHAGTIAASCNSDIITALLCHSRCTGPVRWSAAEQGAAGSDPSAAPSASPAAMRLQTRNSQGSGSDWAAASGSSGSCAGFACCVGEAAQSVMMGGACGRPSAQEQDLSEPAAARKNTETTSDPSAAYWCQEPHPDRQIQTDVRTHVYTRHVMVQKCSYHNNC